MKKVDLRSDTVTLPTEKMRLAMAAAPVGDDVYGEDPSINKLEETIAAACGMEAALFTASGTMGNQVAIMAHVDRGDELICEDEAHIFYYEVAGIAALSGAQARPIKGDRGILTPELIAPYIRPTTDIHQPYTRLICLENTHNRAGGTCYSLKQLQEIRVLAEKSGAAVHMDGARVMNAVVATGDKLSAICDCVDSISICISKGLGAPVGAVVAGTKDFISKARRMRKRLGGGMRQAGVLAAAGLIAFNEMVDCLAEDHRRAKVLARGCNDIGFDIDPDSVETNILVVKTADPAKVVASLKENGVFANQFGPDKFRLVTHYNVDDEGVEYTLETLKKIKTAM